MRLWFPVAALSLGACSSNVEIPASSSVGDPTNQWLRVLDNAIESGRVDYDAIADRRDVLHDYLAWAGEHGPEADGWGESKQDRRLAYMFNTYNAAVIEGVLLHRPLTSVLDVGGGIWGLAPGSGFFMRQRFRVDADWQTLYLLEHQDIIGRYQEPIAHIGLNCASTSCPPLRSWRENNLKRDMRNAMRAWLRTDGLRCDGDTCRANAIFSWYEQDFLDWSTADNLCQWMKPFTEDAAHAWMKEHADDCPLEFMPYDWSLNIVEQ